MTSNVPVIDAEVVLECNNVLGEGILWDSAAQLLRWIDIETAEVHSYDPVSKKYGVDVYPETKHVTNIATTQDKDVLIAQLHHEIALVPATTPTEVTSNPQRKTQKSLKVLASPLSEPYKTEEEVRFNDGGVDPKGRFYAGSMAVGEIKKTGPKGELVRYDPDGKVTQILEKDTVGTSNGIGYSPDGTKMYYVDSGKPEISVFDYDVSTGTPTNRRVFVGLPPAMDEYGSDKKGVFDGLCVDGVGNVWVARWAERRLIGYTPKGEIIAFIRLPGSLCVTIPCFGGKNLDQMFINTARASQIGEPDENYPASGHLFRLDFGPGSEIRKLLGEDWKGAEKYSFGA